MSLFRALPPRRTPATRGLPRGRLSLRELLTTVLLALGVLAAAKQLGVFGPAGAPAGRAVAADSCAGTAEGDMMVRVGPICVDKYEASVWSGIEPSAVQYGVDEDDYPEAFPDDGNWTVPAYALSKTGVVPSRFITWFQAQQACALSGKRLLTNAEWQMAAAGTFDPGANDGSKNTRCNTEGTLPGPRRTALAGSTSGGEDSCISLWGVEDMVGNLSERVADWMPSAECTSFAWGTLKDDFACVNAYGRTNVPAQVFRGGNWTHGRYAGQFAISTWVGDANPFFTHGVIGFRCAR